MWPKLVAQLFELLPHITRLVPMADKFFASKSANDKANQAALNAMSEGVRGDLGQITQAHAGLYRQLQDQSAQLTKLDEQVRLTQLAMEQREHRVELLLQQIATLTNWVRVTVVLLATTLAATLYLLLHTHQLQRP